MTDAGIDPSVVVEIRREDHRSLTEYGAIPIGFEVRRLVSHPYWKDYDALPGNNPRDWPTRFAVDRAHFIAGYLAGRRVGGAVLIVDPVDVARLGGERGCALLWDLRVAPEVRRRGIGRALIAAVEANARQSGASGIAAETQDINVPACQLYANAGFRINRIQPDAYPDLPGESLIMWTKMFDQ